MKINMLSEEDAPLWNSYLYHLQEEAPRPRPILTNNPGAATGRPHYFGDECHGLISREEGEALCNEEGSFLIRESQNERRYTLVLRILGAVKNFKLYWEDGQFFVGDKRFDTIYALVQDGLITMYVEEKARDYIQNMSKNTSVYSSLSKTKRLLTEHPDCSQARAANEDVRASPRRIASVRVNGSSPQCAHNGRNTENAGLPYTHHQGREYYDPSGPEQNKAALENQLIATRPQHTPSNNSYYNSCQTGPSIMQNLLNARRDPYEKVTFQNGSPYLESAISNGGAKKSLTPTSSDERKRPKAKKIATEQAVAQCQRYDDTYQHELQQFSQEAQMHVKTHQDMERSHSNGGSPHYPVRHKAPVHLQNRPFHQSAPSNNSPRHSPQRSPMLRNNSDPNQASHPSYQYSLMAQLTPSHMAHVRQLGPGQPNDPTVGANTQISATEPTGSVVEKITLDANDNQMVVSTAGHPRYHSPNGARHSPRQNGFDSPGSGVIPANTFQQLKMFHRRLEEDDAVHQETQDEVTTLRGQPKTPVRLTRSHTTAGIAASAQRPHSGRKARPRLAPRDVHFRQRSEPVELFQVTRASLPNSCQPPVASVDFARYRQHSQAYRQKEPCLTAHQGDLRAGSGSSCDSSLSNLSFVGSTAMPHISESNPKPDSISHMSSEDWTGEERERTPSPHSTSQRSRSSDDNSLPKSRDSRAHLGRQNAVIYADHPESRDVITALQRVSPKLKADQKANAGNHSRSASVPPPESLSGTKPRRKTSDPRASFKTKKTDDTSKTRHHSETSSSEDGTIIRSPYPAHIPLQRRVTTGSAVTNKKEPNANGCSVSPVTFNSPKKPAHRSKSGPSPRKGKKSPDNIMSPRTQHILHQRSLSSPRNEVHYYDKEHVFKSHTYRGLQWCEYCGNFMWGIIQQGMQCRDCGLNVHKQCSKLVPGDCQPALKHVKTVFGIDLTALVKLHGTERPIVIDKCIAEIERRGMDSEGIYRVSGFHDDIQQLKLSFDRYGNEVDLASYEDINSVAGGLKLYLRELPVPLIPYNLYSRFINAAKLSYGDGKLYAIRTALDVMPPAHLQTLKHIIQHLGRICDREENQMDSQNLGIVFGPTMLRPPEKSVPCRYNLNDAQYQKEIVQTIIVNRCKLFGPKKDLVIRETHNL